MRHLSSSAPNRACCSASQVRFQDFCPMAFANQKTMNVYGEMYFDIDIVIFLVTLVPILIPELVL